MATSVSAAENKGPAFQGWMVANLAMGAGFQAFVALLIPPYVTETTGNAGAAGVVMAIISLAAVLGPVLGSFADKYRAHRLVMSGGVLGMAVAFAMYALSSEVQALYALDAIVMGVSIAAVSAVAPVFIVGAGLPQALQAKRLTTFNLVAPIGQVLGGVLLSAAVAAGWSYGLRFWMSAAVMLVAFLVVFFTSGEPAKRIQLPEDKPDEHHEEAKKSHGLGAVLFSAFGMYLLILTLSSVANNGLNNQIANVLPNVYGIDQATTSGLISLAGLLNIVFLLGAGAWLGRSGAMPVFVTGNLFRLIGALGLAVLGMASGSPLLIVAAFMQLFYQGNPFVRLTQPAVAVRFATIPAGAASGWVIGASAIGSFLGSVIGGFLADALGYNSINWMAALAAGLAVLLIVVSLLPAERKKKAAESTAGAEDATDTESAAA
jgi:predicted MFS family arabinose efflux permease